MLLKIRHNGQDFLRLSEISTKGFSCRSLMSSAGHPVARSRLADGFYVPLSSSNSSGRSSRPSSLQRLYVQASSIMKVRPSLRGRTRAVGHLQIFKRDRVCRWTPHNWDQKGQRKFRIKGPLNIMECDVGLSPRQGDDKNRLSNSSQYPFSHTSEKGMTDGALSMGSHNDHIAV